MGLSHISQIQKFAISTKNEEQEKWIKAGLSRNAYFEDRSISKETRLTVVPHASFSYKGENLTSQLRFLGKRIEGDWVLHPLAKGKPK